MQASYWLPRHLVRFQRAFPGVEIRLREPGSGTRSMFEAALDAYRIPSGKIRVVLEPPSNEAVPAAVEAGMGAIVLSALVAAPSLEAGLLHQVALKFPDRDFSVVRHVERYRSRAADELLSIVGKTATNA